jgi:hypothetical protein
VLRKLVTGVGVLLALTGGMVSTSAPAQADTDPHDGGVTTRTWVYVKWYDWVDEEPGLDFCDYEAQHLYPNHPYECRTVGNMTQLWVLY